MSKIKNSIMEFYTIEDLTRRDIWINRINPLIKFIITISYIVLTVSIDKSDNVRLLMMLPYLIIGFVLYEISFFEALKRLRFVIPLLILIGLASGIDAFVGLFAKGCLTVFATYIFVATTSIDDFCYSLRRVHVPAILVTEILLIYRYLNLLMKEIDRMMLAYKLRAPGQKGLNIKTWGSFIGIFLLRTMDRAENVYESMHLRGYDDEKGLVSQKNLSLKWVDLAYLFIFGVFLYLCYKNFYMW